MWISGIFLSAILASSVVSQAKSITYLDNQRIQQIQNSYNEAKVPDETILNKPWTCLLYGLNSRTIKVNKVTLYKFNVQNNTIMNSGTHIFKIYKKTKSGLISLSSTHFEEVRQSGDNSLISEISSLNEGSSQWSSIAHAHRAALAYAVCNEFSDSIH